MNEQKHMIKTWPAVLVAVSLSVSALMAATSYRYSAFHSNDVSTPTITVTGEGEAVSVPDIATISFTISQTSALVKDSQKQVEEKMKKVSAALSELDVDSKDIKTENYQVNPKYSYPTIVCIESPCPASSPKLEGYEVSETVTVKVRKTDIAGDVLAALGKNEVTNIQGPNFSVENEDKLIASARASAIEKAEEKAKATAKSLGVSLAGIKSYSEGNGGYPYPMMYAKSTMVGAADAQERVTLSPGESKVKVNVTLVYSLR